MLIFDKIKEWLKNLFFSKEMEITLIGLESAGKTTLLKAITDGKHQDMKDTIPTIGLNTRKVKKGGVTLKLWDMGGQSRFRTMWERYCRGVNAIVYVMDASIHTENHIHTCKKCLTDLINKPSLENIPLLILGNKNDIENASDEKQIAEDLDLKKLFANTSRPVTVYTISAKNSVNIDITLKWLMKYANK